MKNMHNNSNYYGKNVPLLTEAPFMDAILLHGPAAMICEGLIITYPIERVCEMIRTVFNLAKSNADFLLNRDKYDGYAALMQGANGTSRILTLIYDADYNRDMLAQYFNKYGYFAGAESPCMGNMRMTYWEKKFDNDATEEVKKLRYIYHICKEQVLKKIESQGLTPRNSQWRQFKNSERIYFFIRELSHSEFSAWAKNFSREKQNGGDTYIMLKVDVSKLPENIRFFADPRMNDAVYTLENIPPDCLSYADYVCTNISED